MFGIILPDNAAKVVSVFKVEACWMTGFSMPWSFLCQWSLTENSWNVTHQHNFTETHETTTIYMEHLLADFSTDLYYGCVFFFCIFFFLLLVVVVCFGFFLFFFFWKWWIPCKMSQYSVKNMEFLYMNEWTECVQGVWWLCYLHIWPLLMLCEMLCQQLIESTGELGRD